MNESLAPHAPSTANRYAVYFSHEPGSPWWQAGSQWLGRCAATGKSLDQPVVRGVERPEQQRLTRAPRRYGWHATLKAPFALAAGQDLDSLRLALRDLCRTVHPFEMPVLQVKRLDDFLALVPEGKQSTLDAVAARCVMELHDFAAPLTPSELHRRRATGLAPEEDRLLLRWGYPFVLDRFRFHFSLTGPLQGVAVETVLALEEAAHRCFDPMPVSRFDAVALFVEPNPGADFVLLERVRLGP